MISSTWFRTKFPKMPQAKTHGYSGAAWTVPGTENAGRNERFGGIEIDFRGKGGLHSWGGMAQTG